MLPVLLPGRSPACGPEQHLRFVLCLSSAGEQPDGEQRENRRDPAGAWADSGASLRACGERNGEQSGERALLRTAANGA